MRSERHHRLRIVHLVSELCTGTTRGRYANEVFGFIRREIDQGGVTADDETTDTLSRGGRVKLRRDAVIRPEISAAVHEEELTDTEYVSVEPALVMNTDVVRASLGGIWIDPYDLTFEDTLGWRYVVELDLGPVTASHSGELEFRTAEPAYRRFDLSVRGDLGRSSGRNARRINSGRPRRGRVRIVNRSGS